MQEAAAATRLRAAALVGEPQEAPARFLALVARVSAPAALPAGVIGLGSRTERVPRWARRSTSGHRRVAL